MSAVSEFIFSVCASTLIFGMITFILPEKGAGKTVRLVASVFVLTVILKAGTSAILSLSKPKIEVNEETAQYDRDKYISAITEKALKDIIEEKLLFAGCSFSEIEISVAYTEDGFSNLSVTVTVESEEDKIIAEGVSRSLDTEFDIRVG